MTVQPYTVTKGEITAILIGDEILETPPIPFGKLESIGSIASEYLSARKEFVASKESFLLIEARYRVTKEKLESALKEAGGVKEEQRPSLLVHSEEPKPPVAEQPIIEPENTINPPEPEEPRPSIQEIAEKNAQELQQSPEVQEQKPHEEPAAVVEPVQPQPEPKTPRQQAESIYDSVITDLKGKSVEEKDIMASVMKAGIHPDDVPGVTEEIINLLKEKDAIDTLGKKIKRAFGGGKKKTKEKPK